MSAASGAPEHRHAFPLADAGVIGDEAEAVDESGGDDDLVGGIFVKAFSFQGGDCGCDGGRDGKDGEFRGEGGGEDVWSW